MAFWCLLLIATEKLGRVDHMGQVTSLHQQQQFYAIVLIINKMLMNEIKDSPHMFTVAY